MTAIFLFMATISIWHAKGTDGSFTHSTYSSNMGDTTNINGNPGVFRYGTDSDTGVILYTSDKLTKITIDIMAARKSSTASVPKGKWTYKLGYGDTAYQSWTNSSAINHGLYSSDNYAWHTYGTKYFRVGVTNANLIKRMIAHGGLQLWWTKSYGQIGANSIIQCISKTAASAPATPVVKYPYDNTTTYNLQPWISVSLVNSAESVYPAKLQMSITNSAWVDLPVTKDGTTLTYTGPIPNSLRFLEMDLDTTQILYFRGVSDVGTSSTVTRTIKIAQMLPAYTGNKILNTGGKILQTADYSQINEAMNNISKYFTNAGYTIPNVTNKIITANQINTIGAKLVTFPPNQNMIITQYDKIVAQNHYNNIIKNAITNS